MITQISKKDYIDIKKDPLTERIIACCFKVHSELGPGFNEKTYHNALKLTLSKENLKFETEKDFSVFYLDKKIGSLRIDLIIDNKVIVEVKALAGNFAELFKYQLLSYLKVSNLHVGLLINFGNKSCQVKRLML